MKTALATLAALLFASNCFAEASLSSAQQAVDRAKKAQPACDLAGQQLKAVGPNAPGLVANAAREHQKAACAPFADADKACGDSYVAAKSEADKKAVAGVCADHMPAVLKAQKDADWAKAEAAMKKTARQYNAAEATCKKKGGKDAVSAVAAALQAGPACATASTTRPVYVKACAEAKAQAAGDDGREKEVAASCPVD